MTRENPNDAAFFFDNGDFLNLDEVVYTNWYPDGHDDTDDGPVIMIFVRGCEEGFERDGEHIDEQQYERLMKALRTYHSKF